MYKIKLESLQVSSKATIIISTVLFAIATCLAMTNAMSRIELDIFQAIYGSSESFTGFALISTQLGSFWLVLALIGLLLVIRKNPKIAVRLFIASVATYTLVYLFKNLISRPRPVGLIDDFSARILYAYGNGYPSGHTAIATTLGILLFFYAPMPLKIVCIGWILLVGWTRIYLGVHAPLDIIGGFLIGVIVATFVRNISLKYYKSA